MPSGFPGMPMILLNSFSDALVAGEERNEERMFRPSAIAAELRYPKRPFGNIEFLFLIATSETTGRFCSVQQFCCLGGTIMQKLTCVLAILAAASTATLAGEIKQDKKAAAPAVSATQMSDAEMDKVTAGEAGIIYTPGDAQMNGLRNSPFGGAYGGLVYPGHSSVCVNGCFF
jgi:hypothetical protein